MKTNAFAWMQRLGRRHAGRPLLGVASSDSRLSLVELGGSAAQPVLERLAHEPLDKGWMRDGQVEDFDAVADALRRLVAHSGTRTRQVALALPAQAVFTQRLRLPAGLPETALELQALAEAQQHLPFAPEDEVCLDFAVLEGGAPGVGEVEVLVAAARKDRVQDCAGLAEAAGLEAVVVDVAAYAVHRAVARIAAAGPAAATTAGAEAQAPVALFEIGAYTTALKLLRGEQLLYEREQPCGGAQFTRLIARQCGLGFDAAEQLTLSGTLAETVGAEVQDGFVAGLAQDLARALQICFSSSAHHHVRGVLLAGATAVLPGLCAHVARLTGFEARLADAFEGMTLGMALHALPQAQEACACLGACGLALRRFEPWC